MKHPVETNEPNQVSGLLDGNTEHTRNLAERLAVAEEMLRRANLASVLFLAERDGRMTPQETARVMQRALNRDLSLADPVYFEGVELMVQRLKPGRWGVPT